MNYIKKAVSTLGGVFLPALLIAALAPRVTRAVVAALVQVANTPANPVPTSDVHRSAAQIVELVCSNVAPNPCIIIPATGDFNETTLTAWTVPAGMNFVITDVQVNTELELDGVTGTSFGVAWTPPGSSIERGAGWSVPDNGETTEFQLSSGAVVPAGSTVTGVFGPDVVVGIVRGYLTPY